jgi:hypothetical protein
MYARVPTILSGHPLERFKHMNVRAHSCGILSSCVICIRIWRIDVELGLTLNILDVLRQTAEAWSVHVPILRDDVGPNEDGSCCCDAD